MSGCPGQCCPIVLSSPVEREDKLFMSGSAAAPNEILGPRRGGSRGQKQFCPVRAGATPELQRRALGRLSTAKLPGKRNPT